MRAASLGLKGKQQTAVTGDKTSSGSIVEVTGCLLFLLSGEASEQQTVVAGGCWMTIGMVLVTGHTGLLIGLDFLI